MPINSWDIERLAGAVEDEAPDVDFKDGFGMEAEVLFRRAMDNGLSERAEAILNSGGSLGYPSASEADFALFGFLQRAGLEPPENACVVMASVRGDDIRERHRNWKDYLKRGLSKIYAEPLRFSANGHRKEDAGGKKEPRAIRYKLLSEIVSNPLPMPPVIIDRWFVAGDMFIATGPYDTLKSRLGMEIAVSSASGQPLLGRFEVKESGVVVIIQDELHPAVYEQRLVKYVDSESDWLDNVVLISREGFHIDAADMLFLDNLMTEKAVRAVLIDPLTEAYPTDPGFDENKATCVSKMLKLLRDTKDKHNAIIGVCHHDPKDEVRKARGSGRLMDAPDVRIEMQGIGKKEGEIARSRVRIRSRNLIVPDPFDIVCTENGRVSYAPASRPAQDEILEAIKKTPGASAEDVANATGRGTDSVYPLLRDLLGAGRVRREPSGVRGGGWKYWSV